MTMVREMQEAIATIQRFVNEEEAPLGTNLALKGVADFLEGVLTLDSDRHGALGRRVEALLASEEPPEGLARSMATFSTGRLSEHDKESALRAWFWFRKQLLGPAAETCSGFEQHAETGMVRACSLPAHHEGRHQHLPGSLATGGATGEDDGR